MGQSTFFWNMLAKRYSKQAIADPHSYERKLEITRKYFTPESEVLEVGCGTGSTALLHAPYVKHIDATDFASKMIEIANGKLKDGNIDNVTFSVEAIDDLANKQKLYDVVLALNIIHLLEDKAAALRDMNARLKPGGYCISSTVCMELEAIPKFWFYLIKILSVFNLAPRLQSLGEQQLLQLVQDAGFTIVEQWKPDSKWAVVFLVAKKAG